MAQDFIFLQLIVQRGYRRPPGEGKRAQQTYKIHDLRVFAVQLPPSTFLTYLAVNLFKNGRDGWMIGSVSVPVAAGLLQALESWNV